MFVVDNAQIKCRQTLMLALGVATLQQLLVKSLYILLMVTWCNWKNTLLFIHVMCCGCKCSILDHGTIFYHENDAVSHGIPVEFQWNSNGISWIPLGIIPGGSWILTISIGIPWKKVGISIEMETQMAEAPAKCFS